MDSRGKWEVLKLSIEQQTSSRELTLIAGGLDSDYSPATMQFINRKIALPVV